MLLGSILTEYDPSGVIRFETAALDLAGPKKEQIARETLRAAGDKTRTKVRRALRKQAGYKSYGVVTSRTRSYMEGWSEYHIVGTGKGVPIDDVKGVRVVRKGVRAAPWNKSRVFKRSFSSGGLKARLGKERHPTRKLYGPAVYKELVKDQSLDAFNETGPREVARILPQKLARLLP